jgi:hypothetical protein
VPQRQIQQALRQLFGEWGLPQGVQLDNGYPWAVRGGLPSGSVLWLVGLGLEVAHIPPRRPQANGVVERGHGTAKRWVGPDHWDSPEQLQREIDRAERRQRERYPYRGQRSRLEVHPGLAHSGRAYSPDWEEENFQLRPAQELLAGCVAARQVDKAGRVSVYSRDYYVGRSWAGQTVYVRYDPQAGRWMFSDEQGRLLQHHAAPEISREGVRDLTATNGRAGHQ